MVNEDERHAFEKEMISLITNLLQSLTHNQLLVILTWRYMVVLNSDIIPSFKEGRLK